MDNVSLRSGEGGGGRKGVVWVSRSGQEEEMDTTEAADGQLFWTFVHIYRLGREQGGLGCEPLSVFVTDKMSNWYCSTISTGKIL